MLLKWSRQVGDLPITTTSKVERQKEFLAYSEASDLSPAEINLIQETGLKQPKRVFWDKLDPSVWDAQS